MELTTDAGYMAHAQGQGMASNPHPEGTDQHADWRDGWHAYAMDEADARGQRDMRVLLEAFRL